ncbi:MAG: Aminodeoxychorismate lyase [Candidatus Gottesmanbacteria bacterium GW2011_GWC2_39_8]|uniref:Endolytic murein transglycosylase n=1 Tax=Candidatus Gottesmanbacteria bacterium GW2011_GWC2_39_8 TaxID=1618450 RepID=A0A0G0Q5W3_9BACT|nr:MAG: Aminodeoxychorismate lyase [Candidatus Gottesmanbacteria bacterium GW2011_GWC2_39_8]
MAVNYKDNSPKSFRVKTGESIRQIAAGLEQEGLIRSPVAFFILNRFGGKAQNIQAGDFLLKPSMNLREITDALTHGTIDAWITTLEGWRNEEIADKLHRDLGIDRNEFLKVAKEGYMFPDTYRIPKNINAQEVADIFLSNFHKKVSDDLLREGEKQNISRDQILTLASIIEREAKNDTDRPIVAGILLKRLGNDWPLETDATIQYALGYQTQQKTWWKKELTADDLEIVSPYNTRKEKGIPPAPISNPGLAAISAVVYPKNTEYWYYLSDNRGVTHFAKTLTEHENNIAKYLSQ